MSLSFNFVTVLCAALIDTGYGKATRYRVIRATSRNGILPFIRQLACC